MARKPKALPPGEPYTPGMIANILSEMPDDRLAVAGHEQFQRWPVKNIVPGITIRELIANEKAKRRTKNDRSRREGGS